jgi:hypothetical protein
MPPGQNSSHQSKSVARGIAPTGAGAGRVVAQIGCVGGVRRAGSNDLIYIGLFFGTQFAVPRPGYHCL